MKQKIQIYIPDNYEPKPLPKEVILALAEHLQKGWKGKNVKK